ncbi:MAG: HAD hydrolase family protein [Candidatus Adiutrix sp.]|jgi:3-deoxy-D-manno-octulosonate 8-phosphate phosphatase (KDO 8-P phosphatase)|nr:HAD hydrolase family protein [Candidatus Adiutrix sp.]
MLKLDLGAIKLVGFDVDGVLTDGRIIIDDEGRESKNFHSRDGLGLKILLRAGLEAVLITGRASRLLEIRARGLGLTEIYQGVEDKWAVFEEVLKKKGLSPAQAAFAGDDLIDLPVMARVGLALAPADAAPDVLAAAHFVAPAPGGRGAVRQMIEFLLKGQGRWDEVLRSYLPPAPA